MRHDPLLAFLVAGAVYCGLMALTGLILLAHDWWKHRKEKKG